MPSRQVKRTGTRMVTKSRDVVKQDSLGYTEIEIHRPKILFFEFQGLRPNIPHWIFYGDKQVTKWCNTAFGVDTYTNSDRDSFIKEPGDRFVNATEFPFGGGATNGGGDAPLTSAADGSIKGLFYLQSNADLFWPTNTDGTNFSALDISVLDRNESLSYAAAKFYSKAQYEDWYEYTTTEEVQVSENYTYYETVQYSNSDGGGSSGWTVLSNGAIVSASMNFANVVSSGTSLHEAAKISGLVKSANNGFGGY